jgi:hypothetical protein
MTLSEEKTRRPRRRLTKRSPAKPVIEFLNYFKGIHQFTDKNIDRIIGAVAPLPEGKVKSKRWIDDGSSQRVVLVDRRDELAHQLELTVAALHWKDSRRAEPASKRQKQFEAIEAAADRLLKSLMTAGFIQSESPAKKPMPPADFLQALAIYIQKAKIDEKAALPNDWLVDCVHTIKAVRNSAMAAKTACAKSKTTGRSGSESRHKGNESLQDLVRKLKAIHRTIWKKPARISRPPGGGLPTGPFVRFVSTCFSILQIDKTDEAIAHKARAKSPPSAKSTSKKI